MFFTRTHTCHFSVSQDDVKSRLVGKHVKIHDMDFEVLEKGSSLSIIPHAEQEVAIKTLPITQVDFKENGGKTKVIITSKMRKFDSGGPMLVLIFCAFMLIAAAVLFNVEAADRVLPYTLASISGLILLIFGVRMQTGYFDYVRKIRSYVENGGNNAGMTEANMPILQL